MSLEIPSMRTTITLLLIMGSVQAIAFAPQLSVDTIRVLYRRDTMQLQAVKEEWVDYPHVKENTCYKC
jgi:hypothetical protein